MSDVIEFSPEAWPQCSKCGATYVMRRVFAPLANGDDDHVQWIWTRDCRHTTDRPVMAGPEGILTIG